VTYIHYKRDKPSVEHVSLTNDSVIALLTLELLLLLIDLVRSRKTPAPYKFIRVLFAGLVGLSSPREQKKTGNLFAKLPLGVKKHAQHVCLEQFSKKVGQQICRTSGYG
jgi:hypothetical protein